MVIEGGASMMNIVECKTFEHFVYQVTQNAQQGLEIEETYDSIDILHDTLVREGGSWEILIEQVAADQFEIVRYEGKVVIYSVPFEARKI